MKKEIVDGIQTLIEEIKTENHIINEIIRDDVFFIKIAENTCDFSHEMNRISCVC